MLSKPAPLLKLPARRIFGGWRRGAFAGGTTPARPRPPPRKVPTMTTDETTPRWTEGAHHVGLTVRDVAEAERFFVEALGHTRVGAVPTYPAAFVSDGATMITLWQAEDPAGAAPFDRRRNLGLHHLALRVREGALDALHERLAARADVEIEFAPSPLGAGPTRHMMARVCGGLRVEFIAPGGG